MARKDKTLNESAVMGALGAEEQTNKPKPVPRKAEPDNTDEIWINKTYSIRTGSIKDIDRIAYWTRNRVGELVNMALMEFIENIKKGDYIEGNKEALTKKGEIKELPESELKNRAARSARMGRPKKK